MTNVFYPELTPSMKFATANKPTRRECIEYFTAFLSRFEQFSAVNLQELEPVLHYATWKRNETIFETGKSYEYMTFIVSGAVEFYTEDKNGKHIIGFLTDCNFCSPMKTFFDRLPSEEGVLCTEDTYGLQISLTDFISLIQRPEFASFFQTLNGEVLQYFEQRLRAFQSLDAKDRYNALLKESPELFNRFPLQDIANFLGIKPETLSRIRKGKSRNADN
jgi:CRP-like cAMP-binding protein